MDKTKTQRCSLKPRVRPVITPPQTKIRARVRPPKPSGEEESSEIVPNPPQAEWESAVAELAEVLSQPEIWQRVPEGEHRLRGGEGKSGGGGDAFKNMGQGCRDGSRGDAGAGTSPMAPRAANGGGTPTHTDAAPSTRNGARMCRLVGTLGIRRVLNLYPCKSLNKLDQLLICPKVALTLLSAMTSFSQVRSPTSNTSATMHSKNHVVTYDIGCAWARPNFHLAAHRSHDLVFRDVTPSSEGEVTECARRLDHHGENTGILEKIWSMCKLIGLELELEDDEFEDEMPGLVPAQPARSLVKSKM
ncbi:hypothetical protein MSAN_01318800 [Mycena sanguinolenta]|uniref:Uncharacterized protein n=1 Tax=Mycena sanguinolenta TaxID=230812 RepID=A0A8H7D3C2_9AGAR|nr:hypothetical protein MSAN_01318800 [Mycena sanguinolenta]